jgi:hypothetical protein
MTLKIHIIAPSVTEASTTSGSLGSALAGAASIIEASGFYDELPALGIEIDGITRPEPVALEVSDDPTVRLGEFNAQVAEAVSAAIGRGAHPFLAGGTCSHLPGMVGGLEQAYGPTARIGLIWMPTATSTPPKPAIPRCSVVCRSRWSPASAIPPGGKEPASPPPCQPTAS